MQDQEISSNMMKQARYFIDLKAKGLNLEDSCRELIRHDQTCGPRDKIAFDHTPFQVLPELAFSIGFMVKDSPDKWDDFYSAMAILAEDSMGFVRQHGSDRLDDLFYADLPFAAGATLDEAFEILKSVGKNPTRNFFDTDRNGFEGDIACLTSFTTDYIPAQLIRNVRDLGFDIDDKVNKINMHVTLSSPLNLEDGRDVVYLLKSYEAISSQGGYSDVQIARLVGERYDPRTVMKKLNTIGFTARQIGACLTERNLDKMVLGLLLREIKPEATQEEYMDLWEASRTTKWSYPSATRETEDTVDTRLKYLFTSDGTDPRITAYTGAFQELSRYEAEGMQH